MLIEHGALVATRGLNHDICKWGIVLRVWMDSVGVPGHRHLFIVVVWDDGKRSAYRPEDFKEKLDNRFISVEIP